MNVADSERMAALLAGLGMDPADEIEQAQVIIINGCSVREKAVHKAVSQLGELQLLKRDPGIGGAPIIGMGGCVGQLDQKELFKRAPYLDFVFGTDTIDNLPEIHYPYAYYIMWGVMITMAVGMLIYFKKKRWF